MSTTTNIFTDIGEGRITYREIKGLIGVLAGERTYPRMIDAGLNGYKLGLYNEDWANQTVTPSGAQTYYVQVVPVYQEFVDPQADPLKGAATAENITKGTTFYFDPFPDGYCCDGYEVWAGTVTGTLYYQGLLDGRFLNTFTVGVTWTYVSSGAVLDPVLIGPPAFANIVEVYQAEGEVNTRMFMGGGKVYTDGYAKVATAAVAPSLACDTAGSAAFAVWAAITNGSFRMRVNNDFFDFTAIDFTGDASMANVATTLQTKIQAALDPKLICGSAPETTIATWQAITTGSFNIVVNGISYDITGLNFSAQTTMANMATVIQTALRSTVSTNMNCSWDSTAGRFVISGYDDLGSNVVLNGNFADDSIWVIYPDWVIGSGYIQHTNDGSSMTLPYELCGTSLAGKSLTVTCKAKVATHISGTPSLGFTFCAGPGGGGGAGGATMGALNTDGSWHNYSGTINLNVYNAVANYYDAIKISIGGSVSGEVIQIDDIVVVETPGTQNSLGYCSRHSAETGTDVSEMMAARVESVGVVLNRYGKAASSHTVTWSTDHFVIADVNTGSSYRLSLLDAVSADAGTNISGASWLNALSTSDAVYTPGQTARRSVLGNGTEWGDWGAGTKFRMVGEAKTFLVSSVRSETELLLDENYYGDAFDSWVDYNLEPYSDQIYIFDRGNPFVVNTDNIVELPTGNSDTITAIWASGGNTAVFMKHHIWLVDAVSVTTPTKIKDFGAPNHDAVIRWDDGLAFFSGNDFMNLSGGRVSSLDPENRVKELISRISPYANLPHGVYLKDDDADILMWFVGLDSSRVYNVAICCEPKTGAWYLYNLKDANASAILYDDDGRQYLITGSTYNDAHSIPAFTFFHDDAYKHDGASADDAKTKQGVIATGGVGTATETGGSLVTAATAADAASDWTGVTTGCFSITIDGVDYDVGPISFATAASMADVATLIQASLRTATSHLETVVWSTDHFVISSSTATNVSDVSCMRPYYIDTTSVDISCVTYANGRKDHATMVRSVSTITLSLRNDADTAAAALLTTYDGEKGCYMAFCSPYGLNLQYGLVVSNTANTVTITPAPSTSPEAGWHWFMGGIVPTWLKWLDFNSPQHKKTVHGVAVTTQPDDSATFNYLFLHGFQDLVATVRTYKRSLIGSTEDTVNTFRLKDKPATQHGFKLIRPSSVYDLKIEDVTITHRPRV